MNVEINTLVAQRKIRVAGKQEDVHKCEELIKQSWSSISVKQDASLKQNSTTMTAECPICYDVANYYLQACGHAYCLDCLKREISTKFDTTLSNKTLEVKCMMPQCNVSFLLRDIKTIIDPTDIRKLARASFQAYLKTDQDIAQCLGIDCCQVSLQKFFVGK